MQQPSKGRLWLFRLIAVTLAPLVFLLLLEGALRLAGYGYPTSFFVPLEGRSAVATNPAFGWRFFPSSLARRPVPQDLAVPKPYGTYRIFILGGSAAMGIPDPAYGLGRVLQALLEEAFPDRRFEVINAAMTAINSHVVQTIAEDCAGYEPDLLVVYLGNNEVVGPWGAGSVLKTFSPHRWLIRAGIAFLGTRSGQLFANLTRTLLERDAEPTSWQGMRLFVEHRLAANDPRLARVYEHFRENLAGIIDAGRDVAARVVVSTVAVNLRHSPPFASLHRQGLTAAEEQRFSAAMATGRELALAGDWEAAEGPLLEAAEIDDQYAELRYLLAWLALGKGDKEAAHEHFRAARDLDALRFRADSRIAGAVREVAGGRREEGVHLVDAEARLAAGSLARAPGDELFWEHVHLRFAGNYQLALAIFEEIAPHLAEPSSAPRIATQERVAEHLALTPWDRLRVAEEIDELMSGLPFTEQLDAAGRAAARRAHRLSLLPPSALGHELAAARRAYSRAVEQEPEDLILRSRYAALLRAAGDPEAAVEQLQVMVSRLPQAPGALTDLGTALMEAGRFAEAEDAYLRAEAVDPFTPDLPLNLGILELRQERLERAVAHFRRALDRDVAHLRARLNLAATLDDLERPGEALSEYRRAVELAPDRARAHYRLGSALAERGELEGAIRSYRRALELDPNDVRTRYNLAVALERPGDLDGAIEHLTAALRLDPTLAQARDNLAAIHGRRGAGAAQRGDLSAAVAAFRQAVAVHPEHAPSRYNLAQALGLSGDVDAAIDELRATLGLARREGQDDLAADVTARLHALGVVP